MAKTWRIVGAIAAVGMFLWQRNKTKQRRAREEALRALVRERERLAELSAGGSAERPITVDSVAVIEPRVGTMHCPQCAAGYTVDDHLAPEDGLRTIAVRCRGCGTRRTLWFRLGSSAPS